MSYKDSNCIHEEIANFSFIDKEDSCFNQKNEDASLCGEEKNPKNFYYRQASNKSNLLSAKSQIIESDLFEENDQSPENATKSGNNLMNRIPDKK